MNKKNVRTKKKTVASKKTKKKYVFANRSAPKGKPLVVRFNKDAPNPDHFNNRDLSWLDFNARVMHEALDKRTPLLERLRFMSIWRSNNDEFFMKRVGALFNKQLEGNYKITPDGLSYRELYTIIRQKVEKQKKKISHCFEKEVVPALNIEGIFFMKWNELKKAEKDHLLAYFKKNIFPILTPLAVDSATPFLLFQTYQSQLAFA